MDLRVPSQPLPTPSTSPPSSSAFLARRATWVCLVSPLIRYPYFKPFFGLPIVPKVITGAHYDSTGGSTTARSPGAEDDGSGVVVIMEALRVLVASSFAPKNTLEFHFYGGEEGGLLGSRDVFANYRSNGRRVLAYLNQDMSGYSPGGKLTIYTDYVDTGLTAYVRRIAQASAGVAPSSSSCGYGCSDHASARSNGFPAAYVGDEPIGTSATWIHSSNDVSLAFFFFSLLVFSVSLV